MDELSYQQKNQQLEEDYAHLLYVVSHDIGKYVRHMREFTSILTEEAPEKFNAEEQEYAAMLQRAAHLSDHMIEALRTYANVEQKGKALKPLNMNELTRNVCKSLQNTINKTSAHITVEGLPSVRGDEEQLAYVLEQCLKNAMLYVAENVTPHIHIAYTYEDGRIVFSIKDNGIGVEAKDKEHIFKLFTRLHAEDAYPGIGAGLGISKRIMKRHHAQIWCEASPKGGTCFYLSFSK